MYVERILNVTIDSRTYQVTEDQLYHCLATFNDVRYWVTRFAKRLP